MPYVDVFLIPVPKARLADYDKIGKQFAALWKEWGATDYVEYIGDDVPAGEVTSFPRAVQAKEDEVLVIGWATYPSKAVRDATNEKMRTDPRMAGMEMPFDGRRMIFGGFRENTGA
jgi:uncharacterized protein YbaA (DUF1428 family)